MKFTASGSKVICSRRDNTVENVEAYKRVVGFDVHVNSVPPHVAGRLTTGEVKELKGFIAERNRIQANSTEANLLEALPELLQEATVALNAVASVNETMYRNLTTSLEELGSALGRVEPVSRHESPPAKRMSHSEAQKERLENIRSDL